MSLQYLKLQIDGQHCFQKDRLLQSSCTWFRLISTSLSYMDLTSIPQHCWTSTECGPVAMPCSTVSDVQTSNQKRRAAALLGLPHYLREDPSNFFKVCEASDSEEEVAKGVDVGLLFMTSQADDGDMLTDILDVAVILEDKIVIHQLKTVPHAFAVLIGLLYSLNIDYPKGLKYTFEVMQKVLMDVGSAACSSKVLALKNKLLQSIV
ncbi:uncharacterized protein LOC121190896 [Toxotes jaculatrix]|uniref:uncharacterized protein LOC121190896 n=1 Tax=Toxotes jaculatrix TaxID=941984 RepID=UPI001B3A9258|nr:uncharacterized protein LOC121190896 [Toxotes jaculatrix]